MTKIKKGPRETVSGLSQTSVTEEERIGFLALKQATMEYKANRTSESYTKFQQAIWTEACRREGKGRVIIVPEATGVKSNVTQFFVPSGISYADLLNMFEIEIECDSIRELEMTDKDDDSGYFSVDRFGWHRDYEVEEFFEESGKVIKRLMSLKHYIIFDQTEYLLTCKHLYSQKTKLLPLIGLFLVILVQCLKLLFLRR